MKSNVPLINQRLFGVLVAIFIINIFFVPQFFLVRQCLAEDVSTVKETETKEIDLGKDDTDNNKFAITLHRPNYFLAMTYNKNPNAETYEQEGRDVPNNYEAKFQLSIKMKLWEDLLKDNGDLYGAYTQMSLWQIYDISSPFRETNYEPELFLEFDTDFNVLGLRNRIFRFGVDHQSNGQGGAFSRSWNRIYTEFIASRGNFLMGLKPWYRIPEHAEDDDNPDIDKYLGYGRLMGAYKWKKNVLSFTFRNNLRAHENRSGLELGWSYGLTQNLRAYLQYFNGYGESLIDYNNSTNRIGVGIVINDWL